MKLCVIERMDNLWHSSILRAQNGSKKNALEFKYVYECLYIRAFCAF